MANRKWYPQFHFFIYPEDEVIFSKFKEISKREGKSMSTIIKKLIRQYVEVHDPGNPQLRIDKILEGEHPDLQFPSCPFFDKYHKGEVYCNKATRWIPYFSCKKCEGK